VKSIAYAIVASTALVMSCFAPTFRDQVFASFVGGAAIALLLWQKAD